MGKAKIAPIYLTFFGSIIQLVAFSLISTLPANNDIQKSFYGYEAMAGLGIGLTYVTVTIMMPFTVDQRDKGESANAMRNHVKWYRNNALIRFKAVATSAIVQFRLLGGVGGLAIVTAVLNGYVRSHLSQILPPATVQSLLQTTKAFENLPEPVARMVKSTFAAAYNLQLRIVIGFSAAQIPAALLLWKRKQLIV